MFRREHHQRIALVLDALNRDLLSAHKCYFGGGTAIALTCGEFRESQDIDFLVSDSEGYRELRARVRVEGPSALFQNAQHVGLPQSFLTDQYGIRGWLEVVGARIKFEIISEGRIELDSPGQHLDFVPVEMLSVTDLVAEKLLANSDRYLDTATFSRDLIDLAFMEIPDLRSTPGFAKALSAYGPALVRDFDSALDKFLGDLAWIDRCALALGIEAPRAVIVSLVSRMRPR
jgi:hypothetical protein